MSLAQSSRQARLEREAAQTQTHWHDTHLEFCQLSEKKKPREFV